MAGRKNPRKGKEEINSRKRREKKRTEMAGRKKYQKGQGEKNTSNGR